MFISGRGGFDERLLLIEKNYRADLTKQYAQTYIPTTRVLIFLNEIFLLKQLGGELNEIAQ